MDSSQGRRERKEVSVMTPAKVLQMSSGSVTCSDAVLFNSANSETTTEGLSNEGLKIQ